MEKQTLNINLFSKDMGRGKEQVRCMERVTWKLTLTICKIDSQWEFTVCLRKLKQGLCVNLEGWSGEADGREVQKGEGDQKEFQKVYM